MKLNPHLLDVISNEDKHLLDLTSVSVVWLAFFEKLPEIALLVTIVWTLLRIWETDTVQNLVSKKDKDNE